MKNSLNFVAILLILISFSPLLAQSTDKPVKIAILLYPGVELLDFAGPLEVFNHMEGTEVYTVATQSGPMSIMQKMLTVTPDYTLATVPTPDILVVPGGRVDEVAKDSSLINWIRRTTADRQLTMSVCTGAYILGEAGLLDGKTVTTHWAATQMLQKMTPKATVMEHTRFVDQGSLVTTAGVSAGIDGALHIVSRLRGMEAAREIARIMEYDKWDPKSGMIVGQTPSAKAKPRPHVHTQPSRVPTPVATAKTAKKRPTVSLSTNIDPVCKMDVSGEWTDTTRYMGKVYGFCSKICKDRFVRKPEQYVSH